MTSTFSIALSGLNVAQQRLTASAHNVANAATEGFHRQQVLSSTAADGGATAQVVRSETPSEGLVLEDVIEQLEARRAFEANLKTLQSEDRLLGVLLDTRA